MVPLSDELVWSEVAQGLVGPHGVGGGLQGEVSDLEFLRMSALCALHAAIELGGARRQDKELDAPLLTLLLK